MSEGKNDDSQQVSRRGFLKLAGVSALGLLTEKETEGKRHEIQFPAILGVIFDDSDGHFRGTWERNDEKPLKGVPVSLIRITSEKGEGKLVRETLSDQNGIWYFDNLDPGEYRVSVDVGNFSQGQPSEIVIPTKRSKIIFGGVAGVNPNEIEPSTPKGPPAEPPGRG